MYASERHPAQNSQKDIPSVPLRRSILIGILRLLISIVLVAIATFWAYLWLPANAVYQITESYTFKAVDKQALVFLGVVLPRSNAYQTIDSVEVSWVGYHQVDRKSYVDIYQLVGVVPSGKELKAEVSYRVILPQGQVSWEAPVAERHLMPDSGIESDDPQLMATALGFAGNDLFPKSFEIYSFTADHLQDAGNPNRKHLSALDAFLSHSGTCLERARLMVALCRAADIPAKVVMGTLLPDSLWIGQQKTVGRDCCGHAWVEFDGTGQWTMADPTRGEGFLNKWRFYGRNDGLHLSYGEIDHVRLALSQIFDWVLRQGHLVEYGDSFLKYAVSSTEMVEVSPEATITKGWDGRWLNTLLVWLLTTFICYRIQKRYIIKIKDF